MKSQRKESHAQNQNAIYKNCLSQRCHKIAVLCMQKKKITALFEFFRHFLLVGPDLPKLNISFP